MIIKFIIIIFLYIYIQIIKNKQIFLIIPKTNMLILILILILIQIIICQYNVPSYYGHFSRNYFKPTKISQGSFTYFQYHFAVDMDYQNSTLYFVDTSQHCIYQFDLISKRKKVIAGICGQSGDRVGDISIMQMNNPKSVVYYQSSTASQASEKSMRIVTVYNRQCNPASINCIFSPRAQATLTMDNLRAYPSITLFPDGLTSQKYLIVSDTGNHCIKKINLGIRKSQVIAGVCGTSGFMDGPKGFNKLNKPTNIGINKLGVIYFYDEGNQYMRKILTTGEVQTLSNGACRQFFLSRNVAGYSLKTILCYDNWVETFTKAQKQHITDPSQINICTEHSSQC